MESVRMLLYFMFVWGTIFILKFKNEASSALACELDRYAILPKTQKGWMASSCKSAQKHNDEGRRNRRRHECPNGTRTIRRSRSNSNKHNRPTIVLDPNEAISNPLRTHRCRDGPIDDMARRSTRRMAGGTASTAVAACL